MGIIETIFENYKVSFDEGTPQTKEQAQGLESFSKTLTDSFTSSDRIEDNRKREKIFDNAVSYARASEKAGFVVGFKMAMQIMCECR